MDNNNIVFIVGAGASNEYGFPTGDKLLVDVKTLLEEYVAKRQIPVENVTQRLSEDDEVILKRIITNLKTGLVPSIDFFLKNEAESNTPAHIVDLCKMCIIDTILKQERIYRGAVQNNGVGSTNWLEHLIKQIINQFGQTYDDFIRSDIYFITFNYDRIIEYKIFETLKSVYGGVSSDQALKLTLKFSLRNIVHTYGSLGNLEETPFGLAVRMSESLKIKNRLSKNINLIGERHQRDDSVKIQEILKKAKQIHFLGFGYLKDNLDVLMLDDAKNVKICSGTTFGLGVSQIETLRYKFYVQYRIPLDFKLKAHPGANENCLEYIKNYVQFINLHSTVLLENKKLNQRTTLPSNSWIINLTNGSYPSFLRDAKIGDKIVEDRARNIEYTVIDKFTPTL